MDNYTFSPLYENSKNCLLYFEVRDIRKIIQKAYKQLGKSSQKTLTDELTVGKYLYCTFHIYHNRPFFFLKNVSVRGQDRQYPILFVSLGVLYSSKERNRAKWAPLQEKDTVPSFQSYWICLRGEAANYKETWACSSGSGDSWGQQEKLETSPSDNGKKLTRDQGELAICFNPESHRANWNQDWKRGQSEQQETCL